MAQKMVLKVVESLQHQLINLVKILNNYFLKTDRNSPRIFPEKCNMVQIPVFLKLSKTNTTTPTTCANLVSLILMFFLL